MFRAPINTTTTTKPRGLTGKGPKGRRVCVEKVYAHAQRPCAPHKARTVERRRLRTTLRRVQYRPIAHTHTHTVHCTLDYEDGAATPPSSSPSTQSPDISARSVLDVSVFRIPNGAHAVYLLLCDFDFISIAHRQHQTIECRMLVCISNT